MIISIILITIIVLMSYLLLAILFGDKNPIKWKLPFSDTDINKSTREEAFPSINLTLKKQLYYYVFCIFLVSFLSALMHKLVSSYTLRSFSLFGMVSVIINIVISLYYIFNSKYRDMYYRRFKSHTVTVVYILTLVVPFTIIYVFMSILLSGTTFPIPFRY